MVGGASIHPVTLEQLRLWVEDGYTKVITKQGDNQYLVLGQYQYGDGSITTYASESNISVEFPAIADESLKKLRFHAANNIAGVRFDPVTGDTMTFSNVSWASPTPFLFEIPTGGAGTLTFTSCVINGAGTTTLDDPATFSGCTFLGCGEIDNNGADLTAGNTIDSTTGTQAITVVNQTELDKLDNCTFKNNAVAIQVAVAGSITLNFDGIKFSGNTTDIKYTGTGTLTANMLNGADASTDSTPGGGTVNIVNTKMVEFKGIVSGSRLLVEADTGGPLAVDTELYNDIVTTDPFSFNHNYTSDQPFKYSVRKASASPLYKSVDNTGVITTNGSSITIKQESDE